MEPPAAPPPRTEPAAASPGVARLLLLLMVVIWALNFSVAKRALEQIPPLAFNALRFPLAAAVLWLALRRRSHRPRPRREDIWRLIGLGALGNLVYQGFFIFGLAHSRAGTAALLLAGTPLVTALLSAAAGHERVRPGTWIGIIATFCGIALVVGSGQASSSRHGDSLAGNLLMIGATLAWAAYTVGSRGMVERYGSLPATAWMLWAGTLGVALLGIPQLARIDLTAISPGTWMAVGYAGALSIGVAYLIWHYGVRQIGNTRTAVYSNLVPVLALGTAWLWLGEIPTLGQIAGAGVILGGLTLAQFR